MTSELQEESKGIGSPWVRQTSPLTQEEEAENGWVMPAAPCNLTSLLEKAGGLGRAPNTTCKTHFFTYSKQGGFKVLITSAKPLKPVLVLNNKCDPIGGRR